MVAPPVELRFLATDVWTDFRPARAHFLEADWIKQKMNLERQQLSTEMLDTVQK